MSQQANRPIGIFDSGVGGLTVLEKIHQALPHEHLIYVGDNAHCPYGEKTKEQLLTYATEICQYFKERNVKMIVLACNTTSANVLEELKDIFKEIPFIGVIESTVSYTTQLNVKDVLVIATKATILSNKYGELIEKQNPSIHTYGLMTPTFVPLVESGKYQQGIHKEIQEVLKDYIEKIDCMILGCTHYPIIKDQIQEVMGDITYVSSSDTILYDIKSYLEDHHLLSLEGKKMEIYTTGNKEEFYHSCIGFFDTQKEDIQELRI